MEAWEINVTLGCTVCALSVYAELAMSACKFGMGASAMASGRSPSMDRISTRRARGSGVGVTLGVNVAVAVAVAVGVNVDIGGNVALGRTGIGVTKVGT